MSNYEQFLKGKTKRAIKYGRKSISIELKDSYFNVNVQNHNAAILKSSELTLNF